MPGSLLVVGIGINFAKQITAEAREAIESADKVFHLIADLISLKWLSEVCPGAVSLYEYYSADQDRTISYRMMTDRVLEEVRAGSAVTFVSYGHPGVFGFPLHESLRIARSEGFQAQMLPGVSSIDCLFSDLSLDPGSVGCQIFEATDFLVHDRKIDESSALILLQVGVIGMKTAKPGFDPGPGLTLLVERLTQTYPETHMVIVYEAAKYVISSSFFKDITLKELPSYKVTAISTLFVPPLSLRESNIGVLRRLGWI